MTAAGSRARKALAFKMQASIDSGGIVGALIISMGFWAPLYYT